MNKRQRKKQFKKMLSKCIIGIDMANSPDYTVIPSTVAKIVYNSLNVPEEYINERAKDIHLQYREFLKINRIVIRGEAD